ncbi:MAG: hypothetical protein J0M07_00390 [Anaerolineae bacterium]|nr:hypothetical protein [Anaerolineae bacterium]
MSLLEDLEALDLSNILNARAAISVSVNGSDIQALLSGGAAQTVLGDLGTTIADLRASVDNPAALIEPLVNAIAALPLDLDGLDLGPYLAAVREGAEILTRLLADFDGNPASLGRSLGLSLTEVLERASSAIGDVIQVDTGELAQFRQMLDIVERGVPTDVNAFVDLAIDILLPFPNLTGQLRALAPNVDALIARANDIALPSTRTAQLVLSLDAVATAATAGDLPAVQRALAELEQVRMSTRAALETDLGRVAQLIDGLGIESALAAVGQVNGAMNGLSDGILDFMEDIRATLASLREGIEGVDATQLMTFLSGLLDALEAQLRVHVVEAIDAQVERLKEWLRDLLRHLPLRQLRAEITRFIDAAVQAIIDADLDRYAQTVYDLLDNLRAQIGGLDLGDQVRAGLEQIGAQVEATLGTVTDALATVGGEITALAEQARGLLEQLVAALHGFQETINGIADAVNNLGIEAAGQQVVDTLAQLRATAEELLSVAPLPEPMRPLVEQLIETVKGVDIDAALDPVREIVAEFQIPPEVESTIEAGLAKAQELLQNLIPAELIASIEAEITGVLDEIRNFDPSSLLSGVTDFIGDAAGFIEGLDPTPQITTIRAPFQAVLDAIDAAHPARLLAPVIEAYNELFGAIHVPPPQDTARSIGQAVGTVGETVGRAVIEPVRQVSPPGSVSVGGTGGSGVPRESISLEGAKPGDIVRLFGYLPNKLREALAALDASAAGNLLHELDRLLGGLAASLRRVPEVLWELDQRLSDQLDALLLPLGAAQLRAQIALRGQASFGGASASFDLNAALTTVASAGPGALRVGLDGSINRARGRAQAAVSRTGGDLGVTLDRVATLIESLSITRVLGNVDDFLAALDPEPVAAELDALAVAIINKTPEFISAIENELTLLIDRAKRMVEMFNPATQAAKFLSVLDVLREELDVFNPARLAAELAEVHAAIRAAIAAYDPIHIAERIKAIITEIANELRGLDPAALLGDLTFLDNIVDQVEAALPLNALNGIGESLTDVGAELAAIDPGALIEAVNGLPERVLDGIEQVVEAIKQELIALLESLDYFATSASAEVSVGVG